MNFSAIQLSIDSLFYHALISFLIVFTWYASLLFTFPMHTCRFLLLKFIDIHFLSCFIVFEATWCWRHKIFFHIFINKKTEYEVQTSNARKPYNKWRRQRRKFQKHCFYVGRALLIAFVVLKWPNRLSVCYQTWAQTSVDGIRE